MPKGYKAMLEEALAQIVTLTPQEAAEQLGKPDVVFVDLRDPRELEREGMIPNAFHATRGMLEFWIDPESPYHKPVFAPEAQAKTQYIFYCTGGWRSALAGKTAKEMGLVNVAHIHGGLGEWKKANLPTVEWKPKTAKPVGEKQ
ncbi:MAG TPA: rhodanese-like domain-containing protein [Ferrovibrio sp.]|uniref:rhodanese-like domain-containing protein n=1 Tax=Ferrovibrio sp. TaxID=1917215 RepID=UPI002ECFCEB7